MADAQVGPAHLPGQGLSFNVTNERGWNDPPPLAFSGAGSNGSASRKRLDPRKRVGHNLNGSIQGVPSYASHSSPAAPSISSQKSAFPLSTTLSSFSDYFQKAASFVTGDSPSSPAVKFPHSNSDPDLHLNAQQMSHTEGVAVSSHASSMPEMPSCASMPDFKAPAAHQSSPYSSAETFVNARNRRVSAAATTPVAEPSSRSCRSGPPSLTMSPPQFGLPDCSMPSSVFQSAVPVQLGSHPRGSGSTPPLVRSTQVQSGAAPLGSSYLYDQNSPMMCAPAAEVQSSYSHSAGSYPGSSMQINGHLFAPQEVLYPGAETKAPFGPPVATVNNVMGSPQAPQYSSMPPVLDTTCETPNSGFSRSMSTPGFPTQRLSPTPQVAGPPPTQGYYSHRGAASKSSPTHLGKKLAECEPHLGGSEEGAVHTTVAALQACLDSCTVSFTNRTLDDITKRIQCFEQMWLEGKLSDTVKGKMSLLVQAMQNGEFSQADSIHKMLVLECASEVMPWIVAVKRLIITSQQMSSHCAQAQVPLT